MPLMGLPSGGRPKFRILVTRIGVQRLQLDVNMEMKISSGKGYSWTRQIPSPFWSWLSARAGVETRYSYTDNTQTSTTMPRLVYRATSEFLYLGGGTRRYRQVFTGRGCWPDHSRNDPEHSYAMRRFYMDRFD
ncbi:hypothetical protein OBBRIDRAFT_808109 [Obba rivulosa]|uniref:Uncharacterized protein n=1 Tax=Obba rivulosa TaxID=1052685 RepID=A0A8E2AHJ8_9APHY|nr:hypothetical protein OBBRIDRAFT_808109 [Obba rivulosa]